MIEQSVESQTVHRWCELVARSVPSKETWWGYDSIQIDDPDGNELLFPTEP